MVRKELNKRSPLRIFENSIQGGLGKGNLGVITSRHGIGKTACLVHMATDKLFRGEHVIHISFSQNVNHVIAWYEDIFTEISAKRELEDAMAVHDEITKNRVIMNFSQDNVDVEQVLKSLKTMIVDGAFKADAIFFDGYMMTTVTPEEVRRIKNFAKDMDLEIWFSVSPVLDHVDFDEYGVPSTMLPLKDDVDVLIGLRFDGKEVVMTVVKDHGNTDPTKLALKLDPKTMLISEA